MNISKIILKTAFLLGIALMLCGCALFIWAGHQLSEWHAAYGTHLAAAVDERYVVVSLILGVLGFTLASFGTMGFIQQD